ncbi:MAG: metal ABC transporter permease, partial [Gemmataceae bacterium]|nr:metal ABC transporter permease [Gemmataceae bacterium]
PQQHPWTAVLDFLYDHVGYNTLIVLAGTSLLGACSGLVGCFAVLRRRALTGDALAHAALPGLCLTFLIVGAPSLPVLLLGALVAGLLGTTCITLLRRWTRLKEDAAIGVVLSVFFALGLVLRMAVPKGGRAGLDAHLLGQAGTMSAGDVGLVGITALACLLTVLVFYKEFRLVSFDPEFAAVQGWPAVRLDLLLMGLVALTVVIGLPAVGVVLMAALLILPGAAARFWTERLGPMLALSAAFGFCTGLVGSLLSARVGRLPTGPIIILVGAVLFTVSALLAPRRGVLAQVLAQSRFRRDLEERTLLRLLFDLSEPQLPARLPVSPEQVLARKSWSRRQLDRIVVAAVADGYLERDASGNLTLTETGLVRAAEVARGHRLWELYLTTYPEQASGVVNLASASVEELVPAPVVEELSARLERAGRLPRAGEVRR